jgi:hypothetical protein
MGQSRKAPAHACACKVCYQAMTELRHLPQDKEHNTTGNITQGGGIHMRNEAV